MKNTLFFIVSAFLIGCGPFVKVATIDDETAKTLRMEIKYYDSKQLASINYETIQPIEATSCKNKIWDPAPSQDNAIDQLRYLTKSYGGNGIRNIRCGGSEGTTLSKNCWNSITCTGIAIQVSASTQSPDNSSGSSLSPTRTDSSARKGNIQPTIAEAEGKACMGDETTLGRNIGDVVS